MAVSSPTHLHARLELLHVGVRKYLGGELRSSPVAEWLNKGLMAVSIPTCCAAARAPTRASSAASSRRRSAS
eukprot:3123709-Pyramimonas_sp.AAC.1